LFEAQGLVDTVIYSDTSVASEQRLSVRRIAILYRSMGLLQQNIFKLFETARVSSFLAEVFKS